MAANSALTGPRNGREANAAFPAFNLPNNWDVVAQEGGGILMAKEALHAFRQGAENSIIKAAAHMRVEPGGIHIVTASEDIVARKVIIAAGHRSRTPSQGSSLI